MITCDTHCDTLYALVTRPGAPLDVTMERLKAGGVSSEIRRRFDETVSSGVNMPPSECVGCRKCEAVCPQSIQIIDQLRACVDALE